MQQRECQQPSEPVTLTKWHSEVNIIKTSPRQSTPIHPFFHGVAQPSPEARFDSLQTLPTAVAGAPPCSACNAKVVRQPEGWSPAACPARRVGQPPPEVRHVRVEQHPLRALCVRGVASPGESNPETGLVQWKDGGAGGRVPCSGCAPPCTPSSAICLPRCTGKATDQSRRPAYERWHEDQGSPLQYPGSPT